MRQMITILLVVMSMGVGSTQTPAAGTITGERVWTGNGWVNLSTTGTMATVATTPGLIIGSAGNFGGSTNFTWGSQRETRKVAGGPTLAQVVASAARIPKSRLAPAAYIKLASMVGLTSAGTDEARVLDAIDGLGLSVYDYDKVDNYLYRAALKQGTDMRWVWKPLRERDHKSMQDGGVFGWQVAPQMGFLYPKQYANRVPARVLSTVAAILENLPDATFLVSDYEVVKPDPFLAVSTPKLLAAGKLWIVERWDEPTFDDGKAPVVPAKLIALLARP